jgi:uncharacterized phage infection (PIP) family protein YhgE
VSTNPPPPAPPTIPLTPAARASYQDLYNKLQSEIENTTDGIALNTLNDSRDEVDTILDMDDTYRLDQNTALFNDLLAQIKSTNSDLTTLKTQIAAVASHISTAADIIAAIDKVLTIVPSL